MGVIKLTLFDYAKNAQGELTEPKEPLTVELEYSPDLTLEECGVKKLSVYVGDDVTGANVIVPLHMLNTAMSSLMMMIAKREHDEQPAILMPSTPKIILPN